MNTGPNIPATSMAEAAGMIDVVIATRGRGDLIDATIASIRRSQHANFVLWIIDQSSDDRTAQAVARHSGCDPRVHYLHISQTGISIARNYGVRQGQAPLIVFTDDDCIAEHDWLHSLVQEFDNPETWAVFGRVLPDPHTPEPDHLPGGAVSKALPLALKDGQLRQVFRGNRFNLGFGHGANMAVRRTVFEQLAGFDELLGIGGQLRSWNDRDFGFRILAQGGTIIYAPDALVLHRHWRGWDEIRRTNHNYAIGAGAAAAKYLRCGDLAGVYLLMEWLLDQGIRQILSGALRWRSWQKIQVGLIQLLYPWIGLIQSLRYPIDHQHMIYQGGVSCN